MRHKTYWRFVSAKPMQMAFLFTLSQAFIVLTASSQQQSVATEREIDKKELRTDFVGFVFSSTYTTYETSMRTRGIEYVQEIRNESDFVPKGLLWASAGLLAPSLKQGKNFPVRNSYGYEWMHEPDKFDASTDLGIGGIEIEKVELPEGNIRKFVKDSAPCYLPRTDVISRRLRDGYPPYRFLQEIFSDPKKLFETFQSFTDGKISLKFSSSVGYRDGKYTYKYRAESNSETPIYFQWLSAASSQLGGFDGLMASVSSKDAYNKDLQVDAQKGPMLVLDVVIASTNGARLPKDRLEQLEGSSRIYGRFSGGMTAREGALGIKDLPQMDDLYVFAVPALIPVER